MTTNDAYMDRYHALPVRDDLSGLAAHDQARVPDDLDGHAADAIAVVRGHGDECETHRPLLAQLRQMFARQKAEAEAWRLRGEPAEREVERLRAALGEVYRLTGTSSAHSNRVRQIQVVALAALEAAA